MSSGLTVFPSLGWQPVYVEDYSELNNVEKTVNGKLQMLMVGNVEKNMNSHFFSNVPRT